MVAQINEKWGNYETETTKGMQELCMDFEWLLEQAEKLVETQQKIEKFIGSMSAYDQFKYSDSLREITK